MIRRREFIALAAACPLLANAQPVERVRRLGVLTSSSMHDAASQLRLNALQYTLQQLGWIEGSKLLIERRWSDGSSDKLRAYAAELMTLSPDAIIANGSAAATLLFQATRAVPIVFTDVPDPVGAGLVQSLARPGGNATGFMLFEYGTSGKWLELLKQLSPSLSRVYWSRTLAPTRAKREFSVAPHLRYRRLLSAYGERPHYRRTTEKR